MLADFLDVISRQQGPNPARGFLAKSNVYVAVQFYPWFNFYFPLFFFMLIYNKYETKENKN